MVRPFLDVMNDDFKLVLHSRLVFCFVGYSKLVVHTCGDSGHLGILKAMLESER